VKRRRALAVLGIVAVAGCVASSGLASELVHGADAVFAERRIVIVWAVLRSADEALTTVVVRVTPVDPALSAVAVDAVDPFGGGRISLLQPSAARPSLDLRVVRQRFGEHPRTEFRFAATVEALAAGRDVLTVYFTGIPDATPELTTPAALDHYFATALTRQGRR
jgi:hypothetical protein